MSDSSNTDQQRREALAKMGTGLVAISVSTAWGQVSPQKARASGAVLKRLTTLEGKNLEALGDVLLPGAARAGIAHFVDDQLGSPTPLLMLRYVDYPVPFLDFYRQGLGSLENLSRTRHAKSFSALSLEQKVEIVREVSRENPSGWSGPPAPLFYFVTRGDAVDVCYGTQEGFKRLNIPYLGHILPTKKW